ncbi:hypothetical protein TIFTF001_014380 [Ficus carica]|uniref:Uncharacterized protein n=1 Tax=Ficus carica TaxID=3494 RepID=A0AA88AR83_FICCA|nr:hypothetical protein TIFTF001_014380 [Ficus carica]
MSSGEIVHASAWVFAADGLSFFLSPSSPRCSFSTVLELSAMSSDEIVDTPSWVFAVDGLLLSVSLSLSPTSPRRSRPAFLGCRILEYSI